MVKIKFIGSSVQETTLKFISRVFFKPGFKEFTLFSTLNRKIVINFNVSISDNSQTTYSFAKLEYF